MPRVATFEGIIIAMYVYHPPPHVHVIVGADECSVEIATGNVLVGSVPAAKLALAKAWIEANRDDLMAKWHALNPPRADKKAKKSK